MNSIFSIDELELLAANRSPNCVSILMPTHRMGTETKQDPIRFKNLLRQAEEQLIDRGLRGQDAKDLLQSVETLDDYEFWQHQSDGLAIFVSGEQFYYYCLPVDFPEQVVVSDRFYLKPLLPLLTGDGQFYILALSQKQIRFFQGTRYSVSEVELNNIPNNIAEALKYDDPEKNLQFHTGTSGGSGDRAAMFHGHGAGEEEQKDNLLRYFRQVNQGLQELLKNQRSPLILAGVDYLLPIYKQANTYPCLLDEAITGNREELKPEELHAQAWQFVQPYFEQTKHEAIDRYLELAGTGQTASSFEQVIPAAYYQRVESLFVPSGQQQWGFFNPETLEVQLHPKPEAEAQELMDLVALHTLLNGGTVYAIEPEKIPGVASIAAVLRY